MGMWDRNRKTISSPGFNLFVFIICILPILIYEIVKHNFIPVSVLHFCS